LLHRSLLTIGLFDTNINADIFLAWITQDLIPKLTTKSIIVMDNASFHKREDIKNVIKKAGHILLFQPPYSPDLNPIEKKWAQAKSIRKKYHCSIDAIFKTYNI
jgi:transposase